MSRIAPAILVVVMLLVGPALCIGGLLEHACDCGGATVQCEHEDSCATDPCASIAPVQERDARASLEEVDQDLVALALFAWALEVPRNRTQNSLRPPPPPDRWGLPYPESDRPLLI